jgi:hypothetical protein
LVTVADVEEVVFKMGFPERVEVEVAVELPDTWYPG